MLDDFWYVHLLIKNENFDCKDLSVFHPEHRELARDELFLQVLESFNKKPVKIFQVGAIESLSTQFRIGSGWSELLWWDYLEANGGGLTVVDINLNHIAHSSWLHENTLIETADTEVVYICGDAHKHISEGYDIYYLDGADINQSPDAHIQTLNQFIKIEHTKSVVIVDDVPTKAQELIKYLDSKDILYTHHDHANGMIKIDMRD